MFANKDHWPLQMNWSKGIFNHYVFQMCQKCLSNFHGYLPLIRDRHLPPTILYFPHRHSRAWVGGHDLVHPVMREEDLFSLEYFPRRSISVSQWMTTMKCENCLDSDWFLHYYYISQPTMQVEGSSPNLASLITEARKCNQSHHEILFKQCGDYSTLVMKHALLVCYTMINLVRESFPWIC